MANDILQSFGLLNNFLAQEVNRVRIERKDEIANASAASIAENFLNLGPQTTEADAQKLAMQSIKEAALNNTLKENQNLIQGLYQDRVNSINRQRQLAKQEAFDSAVASKYGMPEAVKFGGEAALQLMQLDKSNVDKAPGQYKDASGRSYWQSQKYNAKTNSWDPIGEAQVIDSDTYEAKMRREDLIRSRDDARGFNRAIALEQWKMANKTDYLQGYASANNNQLIQRGNTIYEITQNAKGEVEYKPYGGQVKKIGTAYSEFMANRGNRKDFEAGLEGEAAALIQKISVLDAGSMQNFKDKMNTNEVKNATEKLSLFLATNNDAILEKARGQLPKDANGAETAYKEFYDRIEAFKTGVMAKDQTIRQERLNAKAAEDDKKQFEAALKENNMTIAEYNQNWNLIKQDLESNDIEIAAAQKERIRKYFKLKEAPEKIDFKFFDESLHYKEKARFFRNIKN